MTPDRHLARSLIVRLCWMLVLCRPRSGDFQAIISILRLHQTRQRKSNRKAWMMKQSSVSCSSQFQYLLWWAPKTETKSKTVTWSQSTFKLKEETVLIQSSIISISLFIDLIIIYFKSMNLSYFIYSLYLLFQINEFLFHYLLIWLLFISNQWIYLILFIHYICYFK